MWSYYLVGYSCMPASSPSHGSEVVEKVIGFVPYIYTHVGFGKISLFLYSLLKIGALPPLWVVWCIASAITSVVFYVI